MVGGWGLVTMDGLGFLAGVLLDLRGFLRVCFFEEVGMEGGICVWDWSFLDLFWFDTVIF